MQRARHRSGRLAAALIVAITGLCGSLGRTAHAASACDLWAGAGGKAWDGAAGTYADPIGSLTELAGRLAAGQTGCIKASAPFQPGGEAAIASGGTPGHPKTIRSEPGARATILGPLPISGSDIVVQDLTLTQSASASTGLVEVLGDRVQLLDDDISNPKNICITVGRGQSTAGGQDRVASDDFLIARSKVHNCGTDMGEDFGKSGWHGLYLEEGTGARVTGNLVYDNQYRGLQVYPNPKNVEIDHNVFDGNATNLNIGHLDLGAEHYIAESIDIHDNVITNARLEPDSSKNPAQIHGNMPNDGQTHGNHVHDNCMFFANATWNADMSKQFSGYGYDQTNNTFLDPKYADRAAHDFRLSADSPCRGKGPESIQPSTPSTVKPDALIRRAPNGTTIGDGIYSTDGSGQTAALKLVRGKKATFTITLQNDNQNDVDSFRVHGCGSSTVMKVTYAAGGTDVTGAVTGGTYDTPVLIPDTSTELTMTIKATRSGTANCLIEAMSNADSSTRDAVGVAGKITR